MFCFFNLMSFFLQLSQDEATTFYDELNHHIFELVSSSDVNEKKGGILAIGELQTYVSARVVLTHSAFDVLLL